MTVAEVTPLVVGVGGLVVAALSLVLNYKARVSHFRQAIYAKQMEGFTEVFQALAEWYQFALVFTTMNGFKLNGDAVRVKFRTEGADLNRKVFQAELKWKLLLPSEFNDAVEEYWRARDSTAAVITRTSPGASL